MYLCSSYCLLCMFSVSDSSIYMIYCRSFNFSYVICYYLYLHTWITSLDHVHVYLLSTPSGFIICTLRVASDNPEFLCPDPGVWIVVALLYLIRVAQRERGLAVACPDPLSSSILMIGSRDFHLATREYFPVFHIVYPAFVFLSDLIFLRYYAL